MITPGTVDYLDTAPDVIAFRGRGTFTRATLDPLIARFNAAIAGFPKVHIYFEVSDFGGIAFEDVIHYLGQALPILGKLKTFGRVAVVSDQGWIRGIAQLESAILPHVTYRTFTLGEAPTALAWVTTGA